MNTKKSKKQQPNDQQHIIEALSICDYMYVWQKVKWIGYRKVSDIKERYLIFCDVVENFRYEENNNFILYYSQRLGFYSASKNETFLVPASRGIISRLKQEYISPTECDESKIAKDLRNWNNY